MSPAPTDDVTQKFRLFVRLLARQSARDWLSAASTEASAALGTGLVTSTATSS